MAQQITRDKNITLLKWVEIFLDIFIDVSMFFFFFFKWAWKSVCERKETNDLAKIFLEQVQRRIHIV